MHQAGQMNYVGQRVIDQFVRPNAIPLSIEFCPLRFVEIYGEIAVKRFGKRGRLSGTTRQDYKAWKGRPVHIESIEELTNWLEDKISPKQ